MISFHWALEIFPVQLKLRMITRKVKIIITHIFLSETYYHYVIFVKKLITIILNNEIGGKLNFIKIKFNFYCVL